jgi:branched-chain amino acid transport system permease protein
LIALQPELNQPAYALYYVTLTIFAAGFWLIYRTVHSPFGQVLKAIRENEPRALSLGYDVDRYKLLAFTLSAGLAGAGGRDQDAGARLRHVDRCALGDVRRSGADEPGGRRRHHPRPGDRAAFIVTLQNELADRAGPWVTVIMGVIFVVCVLLFRRGIVGEVVGRLKPVNHGDTENTEKSKT